MPPFFIVTRRCSARLAVVSTGLEPCGYAMAKWDIRTQMYELHGIEERRMVPAWQLLQRAFHRT